MTECRTSYDLFLIFYEKNRTESLQFKILLTLQLAFDHIYLLPPNGEFMALDGISYIQCEEPQSPTTTPKGGLLLYSFFDIFVCVLCFCLSFLCLFRFVSFRLQFNSSGASTKEMSYHYNFQQLIFIFSYFTALSFLWVCVVCDFVFLVILFFIFFILFVCLFVDL